MEGYFLQSLAVPGAGPCQCQRREMTISTNTGLVNRPVPNLLMQLFTLGSSKIEIFETCYYDIVTTQYDHPRYVQHVLGRIYMIFTLFGYWLDGGGGGGGSRDWYTTCSFSLWIAQKSKFSKLTFLILRSPKIIIQSV